MSDTTAFKVLTFPSARKRDALRGWRMWMAGAGEWLREARRRRRSRLAIESLDARMLSDIGVSWAEAETEANKPWWRG